MLTASLKHHFEALGGNIVQITFEDTEVKVTGGIGGLLVRTICIFVHNLIRWLACAWIECLWVHSTAVAFTLVCLACFCCNLKCSFLLSVQHSGGFTI